MATPKISVIVPVYNATAYLERCVGSLLLQTLSDFEILLIDDGSNDGSAELCDDYARKDSRVKVYHKPNGGVASARQLGVNKASGDYSIHIDPDDWVLPTMLEELYGVAVKSEADMVICDFTVVDERGEYCSIQQPHDNTPTTCLKQLLSGLLHGSLCNKLIRTALYKEFNISFVEGLNYCEDFMVCVQLFLHDIKIEYLAQSFYYYDQIVNDNSITRKYTINTLHQRLKFVEVLRERLQGEFAEELSTTIAGVAYECLRSGILSSREFAETFGCNKEDFKRSRYKRKRRLALCMAASGYQWLARCIIKR
ncbi:MAG: glycosyltransferase [Rikenellaceae bacterium]|nr:glycosyltransferase [Rikenellaceae bacterium]